MKAWIGALSLLLLAAPVSAQQPITETETVTAPAPPDVLQLPVGARRVVLEPPQVRRQRIVDSREGTEPTGVMWRSVDVATKGVMGLNIVATTAYVAAWDRIFLPGGVDPKHLALNAALWTVMGASAVVGTHRLARVTCDLEGVCTSHPKWAMVMRGVAAGGAIWLTHRAIAGYGQRTRELEQARGRR